MTRSSLTLALVLACGIGASAVASQTQAPQPAEAVVGQAVDQPESRLEAREAIDGAVAAAMIGAISSQFGDQAVEVKLDRVDVLNGNVIERVVRGHGRLQIGNEREWLGFDFDALYDTEQNSVYYPRLVLGNGDGDTVVPGSALAKGLTSRAQRTLATEFAQQSVDLSLSDITARDAGERYLQVHATGVAQFEGEGGAEAVVTGVYDRKTATWLQVDYELGTSASQVQHAVVASL